MNKHDIQEVLTLFEQSTVAKMELEVETFKIKLEKFGASGASQNISENSSIQTVPYVPAASPTTNSNPSHKASNDNGSVDTKTHHIITAPLVGTFYAARQQGETPFASVGSTVKVGDVLCIVEAMKVMNEIRADKAGTIKEIKVNNEDMVQFKQPLFVMEETV